MANAFHKDQGPAEGIHVIHNWDVADATARNAIVVVAADVGKVCRQQDNGVFYLLDSVGPTTWVPMVGATGTGAPTFGAVLITPTAETAYASIGAALAAAAPGELVRVGPGTYAESVTVPAGVRMRGLDGAQITGALATGTRLTLGDGAEVWGFDITSPTDATAAVLYAGNLGATIHDTTITGGGALGAGFLNTGLGVLFVDRARMASGTIDAFCKATSGKLQLNSMFIAAGTANAMLEASGGALIEAVGTWAVFPAALTDGILVHDAQISVHGGQILATNVVHITNNAASLNVEGGFEFQGSTWDVLVDAGITTATVEIAFCQLLANKISADSAQQSADSWRAAYFDGTPQDTGIRVEGELSVGTVEKPSESIFGEGDSYVRGMVVLTTDATASPVLDGGNLTDVSSNASDATAGTFSFQGPAANHTILMGSTRVQGADVVKHWGHKINVVTGAVEVTPKSFVHEIWDGAAWVAVGAMSTHSSLFYRYGNYHLIRSGSSEHTRYGVDPNTTWVKKTINGQNLYWSRIRIATTVTSAPVIQQIKLHSSRAELNGDGTATFHGQARFNNTLAASGNIFGESGGVVAFNLSVGGGTGWFQNVKNSEMNGNNDTIYWQFTLPKGIDTSFPLEIEALICPNVSDTSGAAGVILTAGAIDGEVEGVLVADPAGGIAPIARTQLATSSFDVKAPQYVATTVNSLVFDQLQKVTFSPIDVSGLYEGDMLFLSLTLTNDGVSALNIRVLTAAVNGVRWTHGEHF